MKKSIWLLGLILGGWLVPTLAQPAAQTGQEKRREHGRKKLQRLDTNHDGYVSREEWKRKPKAFDRLDRNHDGVLTVEEIAAGRHSPRSTGATPRPQ